MDYAMAAYGRDTAGPRHAMATVGFSRTAGLALPSDDLRRGCCGGPAVDLDPVVSSLRPPPAQWRDSGAPLLLRAGNRALTGRRLESLRHAAVGRGCARSAVGVIGGSAGAEGHPHPFIPGPCNPD